MKKIFFSFLLLFSFTIMAQSTLSDGLVAYFPLDNNVDDYSPLHINGTNYNATMAHSSTRDYYDFNGNSAYIYAGNDVRNITDSLSVSVWVKTTATDIQWVVGHYNHLDDKGFSIHIINGHVALTGRDGSSTYYTLEDANFINDGQWHHVVGLIAGNKWVLVVDCEIRDILITTAVNPDYGITSQPFSIARYPQLHGGSDHIYFEGGIDEVRVYNRVLSICEICELHSFNDETASIQSNNNDISVAALALYPNPAEYYFKVELSNQQSDIAQLQVYNLEGRLIVEREFSKSIVINTATFSAGTYLVTVNDAGQTYTKKLIVQ
jgi:hypothetical protein